LFLPRVEPVGLHTDGHIEIQTDLHSEPRGAIAARLQLLVGRPLNEFDELDLCRIRARVKCCASGVVRLLPLRRPFPPGPIEFMPQNFEAGEPRKHCPALVAKLRESRQTFGAGIGLEDLKRRSQPAPFQFGDGGIIDDIALPQPHDGVAVFGESTGSKFRKFFNVNIERIQKQPAVRRIGAAIGGAVIEQRVQRIEADTIRPQLAREIKQPFEVGEVPDSPVARRADAIELDRE